MVPGGADHLARQPRIAQQRQHEFLARHARGQLRDPGADLCGIGRRIGRRPAEILEQRRHESRAARRDSGPELGRIDETAHHLRQIPPGSEQPPPPVGKARPVGRAAKHQRIKPHHLAGHGVEGLRDPLAEDQVIPRPAREPVAPAAAEHHVIAGSSGHRVIARRARKQPPRPRQMRQQRPVGPCGRRLPGRGGNDRDMIQPQKIARVEIPGLQRRARARQDLQPRVAMADLDPLAAPGDRQRRRIADPPPGRQVDHILARGEIKDHVLSAPGPAPRHKDIRPRTALQHIRPRPAHQDIAARRAHERAAPGIGLQQRARPGQRQHQPPLPRRPLARDIDQQRTA